LGRPAVNGHWPPDFVRPPGRPAGKGPQARRLWYTAGLYRSSSFSGLRGLSLEKTYRLFYGIFSPGLLFFGKEYPMFSKIFSHGKGVFTRKALPLFLALCFVTGAAFFSGCSVGNDGPGLLEGTWEDPDNHDSYVINSGTLTYDDGGDWGSYDMDMAGEIEPYSDFSASAGIIYVKYTAPESLAGKYIAFYWKELTESKVELSIAINKTDYSNPAVDSIDAAKTKFTMDNVDDWISIWGGPYVRQ
jgi:hypothetical protein